MSKEICSNEQLVIWIKAGIDVADNMLQIWQQNHGYIAAIAKRFQGYEDVEDLIQQSYFGLCQAVENYDPDEGTLFMTYAGFWIRQSMQRYIEDCGSVVRIPVNLRTKMGQYKRLTVSFQSEFGRKPTDRESCYYLGIGYERLEDIKKAVVMDNMGSLDVPIGEEDEGSMYDLLPGQEDLEETVTDHVQQEQLRDVLWRIVDELPGKQPAVIRMRYQDGKTLKETGKAAGVTIERARQLQNKAIRGLRVKKELREFWESEDIYSNSLKGNGVDSFNRTWTSSTERAALDLADARTGKRDVLAEFQKEIDAEWEKQRELARRLGIQGGQQ